MSAATWAAEGNWFHRSVDDLYEIRNNIVCSVRGVTVLRQPDGTVQVAVSTGWPGHDYSRASVVLSLTEARELAAALVQLSDAAPNT